MRPTLAEQLRGIGAMLERVVEPALVDDYAHETLRAAMRALEMLEAGVETVGPFLAWDNHATRTLLAEIAHRIPLADPRVVAGAANVGDLAALDAENEQLRSLLARAVPIMAAESTFADLHAATVAHLRARIARYPYTSTASLPSR